MAPSAFGAERNAILAVVPSILIAEIRPAELRRRRLGAERAHLVKGTGRNRDHPVGQALGESRPRPRDVSAPELARLHKEEQGLQKRLTGLWSQRDTYESWAALHPEAERRLEHLNAEIGSLDQVLDS